MRLWIWRHLRIELPDDWEMLQFARESEAGRGAFADRYQFRLELSWRATAGPPDLARLMSDYLAKLTLDGTMPDARPTHVADWPGIESPCRPAASRFGRYFDGERCLVELVFLWPEERDAELERDILASVATEPERPGGLWRWRAFGMDMLARSGLALHECRIEPASARMAFADPSGRSQESFQRLGMVAEWLDGTVSDWLRRQVPRDVVPEGDSSATEAGHCIEVLRGRKKSRRLAALGGKPGRYEAVAWLCPGDGRLYSMASTWPGEMPDPPGRRLACCEELGLSAEKGTFCFSCPGLGLAPGYGGATGGATGYAPGRNGKAECPLFPTWRAMLEARPVRNAAADVVQEGPDELRISVRTQRARYLVPPLSWIVPLKPTRTVRLDRLGSQVWQLCDGERAVEEIVDEFALSHRLSFHEARVAVTAYLRQLVQRGALAMAIPPDGFEGRGNRT